MDQALALPLTLLALLAVYQQSENLGCDARDKDGGTAPGVPQSFVSLPTHPSYRMFS